VTVPLADPKGQPCAAFWRGRRVLVTGHSGFIGGWTSAWLCALGSKTTGFALPAPTQPSFWQLAQLSSHVAHLIGDVRSREAVAQSFAAARPSIVIHLAAQPLVRTGLELPVETFAVNLMGTVNVLEEARCAGVDAIVVMTSDKVYGAGTAGSAHLETDRLGPTDPYGSSKACSELAASAYAASFLNDAGIGLATVRAGNVIGGGDWGLDRLVPDAVRAFSAGEPLRLRRPNAVRPWQHVLDVSRGLLTIEQEAAERRCAIGAWNLGPSDQQVVSVRALAAMVANAWGNGAQVARDGVATFSETPYLAIDTRRAHRALGLSPPWSLAEIVKGAVDWYKRALNGEDAWRMTMNCIARYARDVATRATPTVHA
jgi:CDP-glucose 4,6-dehydratase